MEKEAKYIISWIKKMVEEANARGVVLGISGGIDSTVLASLCKQAFPESSLGLIMPCDSLKTDETDARLIAKEIELDIEKIELTNVYKLYLNELGSKIDADSALNIKPRLRMTTLYYHAQKNNYLVVGATNKSELITGYFTKHGDSGVDILPLADLTKAEIYKLAAYLNINDKIIKKDPSAGLSKNQTDESDMGFSYEQLEEYIVSGKVKNIKIEKKIESMKTKSMHKRKFPKILKKY